MSCREAPLLLGRVCSSWRTLSRATPRIWSSIHISVPEEEYRYKPEENNILTQAILDWQDRSKVLPLSISVYEISESPYYKLGYDIIRSLTLLSSRWKHIDFSVYSPLYPSYALSAEHVPLLESFSLQLRADVNSNASVPGLEKPRGIFQAPHLQRLSISDSLFNNSVSISWSQLTELIITERESRLSMGTALAILKQCKNLVSCTLDIAPPISSSQAGSNNPETVGIPFLKALTVSGGSNLGPFFHNFHLPMLIKLTYHMKHQDQGSFGCSQFYTFLGRSATLDSLTLTASSLRLESPVINCLVETPNVSQLRLNFHNDDRWWSTLSERQFHPIDNHILGLLTRTSVDEPLCPSLKVIECDPSGVSDGALLSFLQSRTTLASTYDVAHLDRAKFRLPREKGDDMFIIPSEVLSGGSNVEVTYCVPYIPPRRTLDPWRGISEEAHRPRLSVLIVPHIL